MSKSTWGLCITFTLALATSVAPISERTQVTIALVCWGLFALSCMGWLVAHRMEIKRSLMGRIPGISLNAHLRVGVVSESRRKYLFDFGRIDGERLSVYLSPDNVFTVSVIDRKGEPHIVQMPFGRKGVPLGEFLYLCVELGQSGEHTEIRLSVNAKDLEWKKLPFRVDVAGLEIGKGTIGGDLMAENCSKVDIAEIIVYPATMPKKFMKGMLKYFRSKEIKQFREFSGNQCMTFDSEIYSGAIQNDAAKVPFIRKASE